MSIPDGKIDYSSDGGVWTGVRLAFGDSSFSMNGRWKKGSKGEPFGISAKGRLDLKNLIPLADSPSFPEGIRQKMKSLDILSGKGDFSFKGQGPEGLRFSSYEGEWVPKENQIQLKGTSSPLMVREGSLSFSNSGLHFSKLKIQYRDLPLTLEGSMNAKTMTLDTTGSIDLSYVMAVLQSPLLSDVVSSRPDEIRELRGEAAVRLRWSGSIDDWIHAIREGEIRVKGATLRHQGISFPLSGVEGLFRFSPEQIRFEGLKREPGRHIPHGLGGCLPPRACSRKPFFRSFRSPLSLVSGRLAPNRPRCPFPRERRDIFILATVPEKTQGLAFHLESGRPD